MDVTALETKGFVSVEYPLDLYLSVEKAMGAWEYFCELPKEEKVKLAGGDRLHDFGYMIREDEGPRADKKELFHVSMNDMSELYEKARCISDRRALRFIDYVETLILGSQVIVQEFARGIEGAYHLNGFEQEVMESKDRWNFRYIHYFGGEVLAHAHADRGGFTLHLYESAAGGEYLRFDRVWRPWPINRKRTIIFPSMGMQFRSTGKIKALWHRVRANPQTIQKGRFAMVAFIDFTMSHKYDDSKRRLQDFEEGFNYDMPFAEFQKLFTPT